MKKSKWFGLCAMLAGGAVLLDSGCLGAFWDGLWNKGFPAKPWVDIALNVIYEAIVG